MGVEMLNNIELEQSEIKDLNDQIDANVKKYHELYKMEIDLSETLKSFLEQSQKELENILSMKDDNAQVISLAKLSLKKW